MREISQEPIAIIGIGCRFPDANSPLEFWKLLKSGRSAIREIPADRWNAAKLYNSDPTQPGKMASYWGGFLDQVDQFDPHAFGMLPGEARSMDPQQRLLLEVAWEAFEDAGLLFSDIAGSKTSVSVGIGWSDYLRLLTSNWSEIDRYALTGNATSVAANRLSYAFDLRGPSVAVDVGCSSSLSALHLACQSLWTEEAELALAGGVHLLLSPDGPLIISKAGFLSPDGSCRALDAAANGTVLGEGAGIVILKRLSQVRASDRVYAMIYGIGTNHNGHMDKIIAPSQHAQVDLLRNTYHRAGIDPAEIDYIELHGMGFLRGDAIEANALNEVLQDSVDRKHPCFVGSVKTNIGDLESAAGIASVIKVALSLYYRKIPPTLNFEHYNPDISLHHMQLDIPQKTRPWPEKDTIPLAGVTTLALAGANVHAILAASSSFMIPGLQTDDKRDNDVFLLPFSAHTEEALHTYASAFKDFLCSAETMQTSWRNICYTAGVHRTHRQYRFAVGGRTAKEAVGGLDAFLQGQCIQEEAQGAIQLPHLVFFFPHQDTQKKDLDRELLEKELVFETTLKECNQLIYEHTDILITEEGINNVFSEFVDVNLSSWVTFTLQIAQVELWRSWGIIPDVVVGEGWGEIVAAYVAGALSLSEAIHIIALVLGYKSSQHNQHPIHQNPLKCSMYSATVGFLQQSSVLPEGYWKIWKGTGPDVQAREEHLHLLFSHKKNVLLEIGVSSMRSDVFTSRARKHDGGVVVLPSLYQEQSLRANLLQTLGVLYTLGFTVNWPMLYAQINTEVQCVSLPNFPWQRERFWPDWLTIEEISTPPEWKRALPPPPELTASAADNDLSLLSLEEVLTTLWAQVLGVEHVGIHENFFELGGHSLLATQLITRIRAVCKINISLNTLFNASTPATCATALLQKQQEVGNTPAILSVLPTVQSHPEQRSLPFPTTEVQQAYWLGRDIPFESIHVGNHGYIEVAAKEINVPRFNDAIQRLIERHEMLRAVILPDGQQQILKKVPLFEAIVIDVRGKADEEIADIVQNIRQEMDHQILSVDRWPSFDIRIVLFGQQNASIHLSLEVLFVDAWSAYLLIQEFVQFYQQPNLQLPALELSFRDYVLAEIELAGTDLYRQAENYWKQRLSSLPPAPELPQLRNIHADVPRRFVHREARLDENRWSHLKMRAAQAGLTPSGFLLTAFAEVIGAWSKSPRFSINLSVFHRLPLHPQVNDIVGDFTSLIMLAIDHSMPDTFEQHARHIQEQLWSDLDHSFYNGVSVLRDLSHMQGSMAQNFMPIVFTSLLIQDMANKDSAPWQEILYCVSQSPQVLLDHQVLESAGELVLHWQSVDALFPPELFSDMFAAYCQLLSHLAEEEASWQDPHLSILPEAQRTLYTNVNATKAPITDLLLHTLFTTQATQYPRQSAIISSQRTLTYEELSFHSTLLALRLRQLEAQPNQLVGVVMEKGWEQIVAVLAISQSGAAYLPIDPGLPNERILYLLEHGEVKIVLTQSSVDQRVLWPESLHRICVDIECDIVQQKDVPMLETLQCADDLAYVIYTSGSTGLPKGVMIDHRGAVNTILDMNQRFEVGSNDRVLAVSALNFDLSVYDIFGTLAAGGTIVIPSEDTVRDPRAWLELVINERVTIWNSVPALAQMFIEYIEDQNLSVDRVGLRLALLSGDWIPLALPDVLRTRLPEMAVVSLGGATEASIWSILYPITSVDPAWKSIPYGRSMKNQRVVVLNERLEPCPIWVPGQLYIAGVGVARGYWRDEEKTRKSFFLHPATGERLYRTGDWGRYLPDGNIEFLGREDFQVKIRGYRIELGEIEAALLQHEAVHAVTVTTYNETQQISNQRLVAYIVPTQGIVPMSNELRTFLRTKLPEYMVPVYFVTLEALPLTPNGKVDRRRLPAPHTSGITNTSRDFFAPRNSVEEVIGGIWADIFGLTQIGIYDDFFELGGHSMLATKIVARLREIFQTRFSIRTLFEAPTIAGIAEALLVNEEVAGRIEKIARLQVRINSMSAEDIQHVLWTREMKGQ